ncbi:hypothetical protein A4F85_04810 [Delftia sp. GW456-R20]|uniref:DnaJ domain-containing protein n=1 Tax=Delftia sp. GW456-R20 TaxID=1827145 RepID=UPI0007AEC2CD|nr:DnaJ domain-containing protein [Delftia sp. GW456-R20]KZK32036.1 hypothetical protein A4F85_04810 [Delftia sp. GW456-R20]
MQDHYETLGVARDATADEIRAAYRKAASKAHPDRNGGDTARMQAVNAAYEVLGNADSRAAYDRGEHDTSPDAIPRAILREIFGKAIEENAPDVLKFAHRALDSAKQGAREQAAQMRTGIRRLEKQRNRITAKTSRDAYHAILERSIENLQNRLEEFEHTLERVQRVREILTAEYERGTECPEPSQSPEFGTVRIDRSRSDFADAFRFFGQGL